MDELYEQYADLFSKSDLYEYLNIYSFVSLDEVYIAICNYMDAKMEGLDRKGTLDAKDFANEYMLDTYAEPYETEIENKSDFYAENFYIN